MKRFSYITTPDELSVVVNIIPALIRKFKLNKEEIEGLRSYISGESVENVDEENYRLLESFIDKISINEKFGFEDISDGFPDNIIMYVSISKNKLNSENPDYFIKHMTEVLKDKGINVKTSIQEIKSKLHEDFEDLEVASNLVQEIDSIANSLEASGDLDISADLDDISDKISQMGPAAPGKDKEVIDYKKFVDKNLPIIEKKYKQKAIDELTKMWKTKM